MNEFSNPIDHSSGHQPGQALRILKILHIVIGSTPVLFGIGALVINLNNPSIPSEGMEIFHYLPPGMLFIAFALSGILFRQSLKTSLKEKATLKQKISSLQMAHLIRMSLFEVAGIMAAVVCFITGVLYHLILAGVVLFVFLNKVPSVYMLESEIGLTAEEKAQLQ